MMCKIELTAATDRPYWVKWSEFAKFVDQIDLACRESQTVEDYYLSSWFHIQNGERFFNPPAFYLEDEYAFFINGRHRAILLSRYMEFVPMSLTQTDEQSKMVLDSIVERGIAPDEIFDLPDLPIKEVSNEI